MKKTEFLEELQDILQTDDEVFEDENLEDKEEWDSLSKMAVMAYFKKNFDLSINLDDLKDIKTVLDLIKLAGEKVSD